MATCLSALVHLKLFNLEFESPQSRQDRESRHLPPPTLILLPALTLLRFKGVHEYTEDLMARVDTPRLDNLGMIFFNETITNISPLSQFINRIPKFQALDDARITLSYDEGTVTLSEGLVLGISWGGSVGQLSSLVQLCRSFLPASVFTMVEQFFICGSLGSLHSPEIQDSHWLELLQLFTGAKDLYLSPDLTPYISPVLRQLVGERTTEVLPALQNLFLYGYQQRRPVGKGIENFVAARRLSRHPIAVRSWS